MSTSEEWVKIYVDDGRLYYWNRRTQKTENKEVQTPWAGKKDTSSGRFYFWRVNGLENSTWHLPPLEEIPQAAIECDPPRFSDPGSDESLEPAGCWVKVVDATRIRICGATSWSESVEQSLNLIFKLDIAEQCLMYRKALSRVSFIYLASQPAIMITLINASFISFIWKLTSYETHSKTESQRLA